MFYQLLSTYSYRIDGRKNPVGLRLNKALFRSSFDRLSVNAASCTYLSGSFLCLEFRAKYENSCSLDVHSMSYLSYLHSTIRQNIIVNFADVGNHKDESIVLNWPFWAPGVICGGTSRTKFSELLVRRSRVQKIRLQFVFRPFNYFTT